MSISAEENPGIDSATLLIGEVVDRLRPDFPDVTVSKVRFLESEGLVTPERTHSGYRRFRVSDVARIRFVLTTQRDHYLPLKVIAEHLKAAESDPASLNFAAPVQTEQLTIEGLSSETGEVVTAAQLRDLAGLSGDSFRGLVTYGLIVADGDGCYSAQAQRVAIAAAGLISLGIDVRHLRAFRTAADRELSLVELGTLTSAGLSEAELLDRCLTLHAHVLAETLHRRKP